MKIPSNNRWTQVNTGNTDGVLHETHNFTLTTLGEAVLSRKSVAVFTDSADYEETMAIVYYNGNYFVLTDDWAFEGDLSGNTFESITGGSGFASTSDAIVFNGYVYTTKDTSLSRWNGSSWDNSLDTYTAGYPHVMCVFDSQTTYKLAVSNGNTVETLDTSHNPNSVVLSLPSNYIVTCMAYRNGYLFVGTKEINGGEAAIFLWNGDGVNAQYKIDVGAAWVYALAPYRGSVACVTNEGEVLLVNGTNVSQLATFPVFHKQGVRWDEGNAVRGKVYPRGMVAQGDTLYINIEGKCDSGFMPEMKSGVWCYEPQTGLYHMTTPTTDPWTIDISVTHSSGTFTASATHNMVLGDAVMFTAVSGVSGISTGVLYYAIPVTATTFKIAGSLKNAAEGVNINTTGTVTTDTLHYIRNIDNGNTYNASSGAIALTNYLDNGKYALWETDFIYGSSTKNPSGTTKNVLCVQSPHKSTGSITTQRIFTDNISQTWQKVHTFLQGVVTTAEKVVVKYALSDVVTPLMTFTWVNATQLNTTDQRIMNAIAVGDEIVFVDGSGQGRSAHITGFTESLNTISIDIDESLGTAATNAVAYCTKFKKAGVIDSTRAREYVQGVPIDKVSSWIQIKAEVRGFETSVHKFELTNSVSKSAV